MIGGDMMTILYENDSVASSILNIDTVLLVENGTKILLIAGIVKTLIPANKLLMITA